MSPVLKPLHRTRSMHWRRLRPQAPVRQIPCFRRMTAALFRLKFCLGYADGRGVKPAPATEKTSASNSLAVPGQRFVARQPIFDRSQNVFGYELLFRNGVEDYFNTDPELAARTILDAPCFTVSRRFAITSAPL